MLNFVYRTFEHLGSSLFGNIGLERALREQGLLYYSFNVSGNKFLDVEKLQKYPILYMRGGMSGMGKYVESGGRQFKASFESECYYSRHGTIDDQGLKERLKKFDLVFTCAESDLNQFHVETIFCPVWAEIIKHG